MGEFGATAMIAGNIAGQTRTLPMAVYSEVAAGNMGANKKLKELIKSLRLKMLLVPMATIAGTLLFSALALSLIHICDCRGTRTLDQ